MNLQEFKDKYQFILKEKVQWGDMDAFQHVNNTVYFRYFERVRFAYFEKSGLLKDLPEKGIGPILASTQCRYRCALGYPDTIYIGTWITGLEEDRFLMKYGIYSEKEDALAAEGEGFIIYYNYQTREKARMPENHYMMLKRVCAGTGRSQ
jgi:acyl-CoA thioester hydrolase